MVFYNGVLIRGFRASLLDGLYEYVGGWEWRHVVTNAPCFLVCPD